MPTGSVGARPLARDGVPPLVFQMPILLVANFLIFFGPFLLMAVSQIRSYEPGDADWGVKLEDVRGQAEAKEEVRQVVTLWQSGEAFERAGGKRERGLLMLGAPGTGKTMLSKAIATGFNCPFVSIPGSGFAGMFLGMDGSRCPPGPPCQEARGQVGRPVHRLHRRDRRRRPAPVEPRRRRVHDRRPAGDDGGAVLLRPQRFAHAHRDLVLETRAWRERLFTERDAATREGRSGLGGIVNRIFPGGGGGSGAASSR